MKLQERVAQLKQLGVLKAPTYTSAAAKLLSRNSLQRFGKYSTAISYFGSIPFTWDERRQKFVPQDEPFFVYYYHFMLVVITIYSVYVTSSFTYWKVVIHMPLSKLIIHFIWALSYAFSFVMHLNLFINSESVLAFLNQFIRVIYLLEYKEMEKTKTMTKFERILTSFFISGVFDLIVLLALAIMSPRSTQFVTSLIFSDTFYSALIHAPFAIMELLMYINFWGMLLFYIVFNYTYILIVSVWLKNLKTQISKSPHVNYLHHYRILQLLNKLHNSSINPLVTVGHKITVISLTLTSSFAITHFYNGSIYVYPLYVVCFVLSIGFQYLVYPAATAIYKNSAKIHGIFLIRRPIYAYQRRFLKSCAPLKIWVGSMYYFKGYSPLKIFKMELSYTMKAHYYLRK